MWRWRHLSCAPRVAAAGARGGQHQQRMVAVVSSPTLRIHKVRTRVRAGGPGAQVRREDMGAYLCIASNEVPPAVSKRVYLKVQCEPSPHHYLLPTHQIKSILQKKKKIVFFPQCTIRQPLFL